MRSMNQGECVRGCPETHARGQVQIGSARARYLELEYERARRTMPLEPTRGLEAFSLLFASSKKDGTRNHAGRTRDHQTNADTSRRLLASGTRGLGKKPGGTRGGATEKRPPSKCNRHGRSRDTPPKRTDLAIQILAGCLGFNGCAVGYLGFVADRRLRMRRVRHDSKRGRRNNHSQDDPDLRFAHSLSHLKQLRPCRAVWLLPHQEPTPNRSRECERYRHRRQVSRSRAQHQR